MTTANFSALPRCDLSTFPTPLHRLDHLANHLSPSPPLWVKRDDQTTLALGGNKVRKLEFLIAHAKQQGADAIITMGGPQSNHCRLTAAACARTGLACHLVLGGAEAAFPNGNALLNSLCDAKVHYVSPEQRNHKTTALVNLKITRTLQHIIYTVISRSSATLKSTPPLLSQRHPIANPSQPQDRDGPSPERRPSSLRFHAG